MEKTILQKFVTYDFERQTAGATKVGTSEFATRIIGICTTVVREQWTVNSFVSGSR
jgi:hypothetical protein